jgi:OOP family OmpA-OmpF porin
MILVFPIGRAELEPGQESSVAQAQKGIREIVEKASHLGEQTNVELTGHSDSTGIEGTNMLLSQERADNIRSILIRGGVQPSNLHTRGVGATQPLRPEDTEENRRLNRSVTARITFTPTASGN